MLFEFFFFLVVPRDILIASTTGLLPVLLFLGGLMFLDSYKLVARRDVLTCLGIGAAAALVAFGINRAFLDVLGLPLESYVRYGAPIVEESLKAAWLVLLLRRKAVGFLVDAGILGFALGAGFALVENVSYLLHLADANPFIWVVRGFGTAVMHGGTTALVAIVGKSLADARSSDRSNVLLPGLGLAVLLHAFFNQFFFSPVLNTGIVLLVLPAALAGSFIQSERKTRDWLGAGFDSDANLLATIMGGNVGATHLGQYLESLQQHFQPEVVVDLLCYLRLHSELAIQAKGVLMMRSTGFDVPADPDVPNKFEELSFLESSIGTTGKIALRPLIGRSSRDVWQLRLLQA